MQIEVSKVMSADLPRRIAKLSTTITVPLAPDHLQRALLENAALTCPVHKSLSAEMEKPVEFVWGG
jgi:putative redox protein